MSLYSKGDTLELAVELVGLRKNYGDHVVLDGIDLSVPRGEIVSMLGPNGAGKTTTLEIIEGQRRASGGRVRTLGLDPFSRAEFKQLRRRIGVALQTSSFEPKLSVEDMVGRQASYYATVLDIEPLVDALSLGEYWKRPVGLLSEGTKQRLNVLLALVGNPELVLLDEPTAGLDPVSRSAVMQLIESLPVHGMTVILSSHLLEEVQDLATKVIVLNGGRIRATGSPRSLLEGATVPTKIEFLAAGNVRELPAGAEIEADRVRYSTLDPDALLRAIRAWENEHSNALTHLTVIRPTLNDAYVELIGQDASK
ncbi:MAG: ABC transporter ATP-binding protein [Leifsonia sp.]